MTRGEKIIRSIFDPSIPFRLLWKKFPVGTFATRLKFEAVERPQYAFGIYHAAKLGAALGLKKISVIEFGVAGGKGLLAMERLTAEIAPIFGIEIQTYGFDMGSGLPKPTDYRDLPYMWREGEFKMDFEALSKQLKNAKLIIGDVHHTLKTFLEDPTIAPIGFISFDLDLYSSTKNSFALLDAAPEKFLPRTIFYFDDILDEGATSLFNEFTGELLAIKEFNSDHHNRKIAPVNGMTVKQFFKSSWPAAIYSFHIFDHPQYHTRIIP